MNLVTVESGGICLGVYRWDDRKWFTRPVEGNINYGTGHKVLAWMSLPEPYRPDEEKRPVVGADWEGHYMGRFEKVE